MTEEKTCYNCGNKKCHIFYSTVKQDVKEHHETYEYTEFDCVKHDKWKELKVEEIRTDNTETLKNALKRIAELEKEYASLKGLRKYELNVAKLEIEKLEKENAELKKQQFSLRNERNTFLTQNEQYEKDLIDFNENLIKAKKIIKNLMVFAEIDSREYEENYKEAEKFLKTEVLAVWNPKRTENDPDKLTDDVMNDWKEMED